MAELHTTAAGRALWGERPQNGNTGKEQAGRRQHGRFWPASDFSPLSALLCPMALAELGIYRSALKHLAMFTCLQSLSNYRREG
jgi:hypothetical protein